MSVSSRRPCSHFCDTFVSGLLSCQLRIVGITSAIVLISAIIPIHSFTPITVRCISESYHQIHFTCPSHPLPLFLHSHGTAHTSLLFFLCHKYIYLLLSLPLLLLLCVVFLRNQVPSYFHFTFFSLFLLFIASYIISSILVPSRVTPFISSRPSYPQHPYCLPSLPHNHALTFSLYSFLFAVLRSYPRTREFQRNGSSMVLHVSMY